jgi:hypothetical protein
MMRGCFGFHPILCTLNNLGAIPDASLNILVNFFVIFRPQIGFLKANVIFFSFQVLKAAMKHGNTAVAFLTD